MEGNKASIRLPEDVKTIISALEKAGYEAYAVGGCIRDSILGRTPGDWDITTSAKPRKIKDTFRRTIDTGIEHGTVTVLLGDHSYEVTTYRVDGDYKDLRHPAAVTFTASLKEDLKRRDFTINAMAYNDSAGLIDLYGGMEDLKGQLVRCVGDPDDRFNEDALRILRAVRFAAQLDFDIEEATRAAVARHASNLSAVSKERILTELSKLICSAHIEKAAMLSELGLSPYMAEHFTDIDFGHIQKLKAIADGEEIQKLWKYAAEASAWMRDEAESSAGEPNADGHGYDSHICLAEPEEAVEEHNEKHADGHRLEKMTDLPAGGSGNKDNSGSSAQAPGDPAMKNIFALFGLPAPKAAAAKDQALPLEKDLRSLYRPYDLATSVPLEKRYIRFAFLLQGMEKEESQALLKSLKADNVTFRQGPLLSELSLKPLPSDRYLLKKQMAAMKPELFRDLLYIKLASSRTELYKKACAGEDLKTVIETFEDIEEMGEPVYLSDLVLSGKDLMRLGATEGPGIGETLNRMLDAVQKDPQINTIMYLISNFYHIQEK